MLPGPNGYWITIGVLIFWLFANIAAFIRTTAKQVREIEEDRKKRKPPFIAKDETESCGE